MEGRRFRRIGAVLFALLTIWIYLSMNVFSAFADGGEETSDRYYSSALEDLGKDGTFDASQYPAINDKSETGYATVKVIQIAESENKELFIYTYEPSGEVQPLEVSTISMWTQYSQNGKDFSPILYDLRCLSKSGVFGKYAVENYQVTDEAYRYYNISALYRSFDSSIDEDLPNGEVGEKAIAVGQQWCAYWYNDSIVYEMNTFETLQLTVTYNGHFEYNNGLTWGDLTWSSSTKGTAHFIAFNAENYIIEYIYDADMSFQVREKNTVYGLTNQITYGEWQTKTVTLKDTDTASYKGDGLMSKKYEWNRISTASDFISNAEKQDVTMSDDFKNTVKQSQWVFAFYESEITTQQKPGTIGSWEYAYEVNDVTVLRVHFMDVNHKIYNLGAVMEKTAPDNLPDGIGSGLDSSLIDLLKSLFGETWGILEKLLIILIAAIVLIIFAPLVPFFLKGITWLIVWVITAPFKFFKWLFGLFHKRD